MKQCNKSYKCQYGNAFEPNQCAYKENMNSYDLCPLYSEYIDIGPELAIMINEKIERINK